MEDDCPRKELSAEIEISFTLGHNQWPLVIVLKALDDELGFDDVAFRRQEVVQTREGINFNVRRRLHWSGAVGLLPSLRHST